MVFFRKLYEKTCLHRNDDPKLLPRGAPRARDNRSRNWTREWWDKHSCNYELVTSQPVIEELEDGDYPNKKDVLLLLRKIPILPVENEIIDIVKTYIGNKIMPKDPTGDALHLALASYRKCDFLLTWNCNHLANANKFAHIRSINAVLGLFTPGLVTPLELLGE